MCNFQNVHYHTAVHTGTAFNKNLTLYGFSYFLPVVFFAMTHDDYTAIEIQYIAEGQVTGTVPVEVLPQYLSGTPAVEASSRPFTIPPNYSASSAFQLTQPSAFLPVMDSYPFWHSLELPLISSVFSFCIFTSF